MTGIVSLVTLLLAGLGWVGALRDGIRGVFGLEASTGNMVRTKAARPLRARDPRPGDRRLGHPHQHRRRCSPAGRRLGRARRQRLRSSARAGSLVGVVVDTLILIVLLRMLSGVPLPMRDLRAGRAARRGHAHACSSSSAAASSAGTSAQPAARPRSRSSSACSSGSTSSPGSSLLSAAWAANDVGSARDAAGVPVGPSTPADPRGARRSRSRPSAPGPRTAPRWPPVRCWAPPARWRSARWCVAWRGSSGATADEARARRDGPTHVHKVTARRAGGLTGPPPSVDPDRPGCAVDVPAVTGGPVGHAPRGRVCRSSGEDAVSRRWIAAYDESVGWNRGQIKQKDEICGGGPAAAGARRPVSWPPAAPSAQRWRVRRRRPTAGAPGRAPAP